MTATLPPSLTGTTPTAGAALDVTVAEARDRVQAAVEHLQALRDRAPALDAQGRVPVSTGLPTVAGRLLVDAALPDGLALDATAARTAAAAEALLAADPATGADVETLRAALLASLATEATADRSADAAEALVARALARAVDVDAVRQAVLDRVPAPSAGRVPVALPDGLALDATADRAADALEALLARGDAASGLDVDVTRLPAAFSETKEIAQIAGQRVEFAARPGMTAASFNLEGSGSGSVNFQHSVDGGANWQALMAYRLAESSGAGPASGTAQKNLTWVASIPPGTTHLALQTGSVSGQLIGRVSQAVAGPLVAGIGAGNVGLAQSGNFVGHIGRASVWYDDTATALAAGGVFTGAARDLYGQNPGNFGNLGAGQQGRADVRAQAVSDVAGTLYLEVSRDGTTWRRIKAVATSNADTGGLHVARVEHLPATRYLRFVFINGTAAQTHFQLQTLALS